MFWKQDVDINPFYNGINSSKQRDSTRAMYLERYDMVN
jgi:hypothetical protein